MIASAEDVIKAIEEYVTAMMRDRGKPEKKSTFHDNVPWYGGGFSMGLSASPEDEEQQPTKEAPAKLAIAESKLEAYVNLRVMKALQELVDQNNAARQSREVPDGYHELYPEQWGKK